jgi:hypothetical protein
MTKPSPILAIPCDDLIGNGSTRTIEVASGNDFSMKVRHVVHGTAEAGSMETLLPRTGSELSCAKAWIWESEGEKPVQDASRLRHDDNYSSGDAGVPLYTH